MEGSISVLISAAVVAIVHTLLGPDHYLPFVAMARAFGWSRSRTLVITAVCGVGHVLGSAFLGMVGVGVGLALFEINALDAWRGDLVAWMLIGFGLALSVVGWRQSRAGRPHTHRHVHADGTVHAHAHHHEREHLHAHVPERRERWSAGGWALFIVFLFGPCEPMIPLLMVPASSGDLTGILVLVATFGAATVATMLLVVSMIEAAWLQLPTRTYRVDARIAAGAVLVSCGVGVGLGL